MTRAISPWSAFEVTDPTNPETGNGLNDQKRVCWSKILAMHLFLAFDDRSLGLSFCLRALPFESHFKTTHHRVVSASTPSSESALWSLAGTCARPSLTVKVTPSPRNHGEPSQEKRGRGGGNNLRYSVLASGVETLLDVLYLTPSSRENRGQEGASEGAGEKGCPDIFGFVLTRASTQTTKDAARES